MDVQTPELKNKDLMTKIMNREKQLTKDIQKSENEQKHNRR